MDKCILTTLAFVGVMMVMPDFGSSMSYCPPMWTHFQMPKTLSCYKYFGHKLSWEEAENRCRNYTLCGTETAHLVSVGSMEEEDFVTQYWQEMIGPFRGERSVWIGYSKETAKSDWEWTTPAKKNTDHENWGLSRMAPASAAAKPRRLKIGRGGFNRRRGQPHACAKQTSGYYGRPYWQSESCEIEFPFICKMRAL